MKVEYNSNNSGGSWWLKDEDWLALEKAGWKVEWYKDSEQRTLIEGDRFLGALATRATREGLTLAEAVAEWESVTSGDSTDCGCPCCGQPHDFSYYDDEGKFIASGPEANYEVRW